LVQIGIGGAVCLLGCVSYFLSRRLFSRASSDSSEAIEEALKDLRLWKADTETHLEGLFDRVKSVAGRMDREKRSRKSDQDPQEPTSNGGIDSQDQEQSNLYRLAAKHILGAG
jgi:hypothetical protein